MWAFLSIICDKSYYHTCIRGCPYFKSKFEEDLKVVVSAFKAARLFYPVKACELQPNSNDISNLKVFPFFTDYTLEDLKQELPLYLVKAECLASWQVMLTKLIGGKYMKMNY